MKREALAVRIGAYIAAIGLGASNDGVTKAIMKDVEALVAADLRERTVIGSDQIKHMVSRFLSWKLPDDFNPDGGITFKKHFNEHMAPPSQHEPSGTNLFDATQATKMVRHMVDGMPGPQD